MKEAGHRKILIAVTGVSPAILTETVWALAQRGDPWIPDQVIAVTTRTGKAAKVHLCEIPFVRVRGWYEKEYAGVPPSYMTRVNRFARIAPNPSNYPTVRINVNKGF